MAKNHEDIWRDRDPALPKGEGGGVKDPEELFKAGLFLLKRGRVESALSAFKGALALKENEPRYMSYLGLCLAMTQGRAREGVALCEMAAKKEFYRSEMFLNLGRAYLYAGNRRKSHSAFRRGLSLDRENSDIKGELDRMGVRRPPVFPFLDRKSAVNKLAGKLLNKLRLR